MAISPQIFKNRILRKILIAVILFLIIIFIAATVFVKFFFNSFIEQKIKSGIYKASNGVYNIKMHSLSADIFSGSLIINSISLTTDTLLVEKLKKGKERNHPAKLNLSAGELKILNWNWLTFYRSKSVILNQLYLKNLKVDAVAEKDSVIEKNSKTDSLTKSFLARLPEMLAPNIKSLKINLLKVENGNFKYKTIHKQRSTYQQIERFDWELAQIFIEKNQNQNSGKAFYAENIILQIKNYKLYPPDKTYEWSLQSAKLVGKDDITELNKVAVRPVVTDLVFEKKQSHRMDRFIFSSDKIFIKRLNLFRALHLDEWTMQSISLESVKLNVYLNKNLPPNPRKKMPQEAFSKIPFYLNVDSIKIKNADIVYNELIERRLGTGKFMALNMLLTNLSNDSTKMTYKNPAHLVVKTKLMGEGDLTLNLKIPLLSKTFDCNYSVSLLNMHAKYFNSVFTPSQHVVVEDGMIERITMWADVKNGIAKGVMEANYKNLKLSILDKNTHEKKGLLSALANVFIRNNNNDKQQSDKKFKKVEINYKRTSEDGFLRFLLRTATLGLFDTLLPGDMKVKK